MDCGSRASSLWFLMPSLPPFKSHWPANRCKKTPSTPCCAIQLKCLAIKVKFQPCNIRGAYRCTVRGCRDENNLACSPEANLRPGAGYNSDGEYSETSGQRSMFGRPPAETCECLSRTCRYDLLTWDWVIKPMQPPMMA